MAIDTWQEECRFAAHRAMKEVLGTRMHNTIDVHLEQMRAADVPDRRNGSFSSHLLTEVGDLELRILRARTFSAHVLLRKVWEGFPYYIFDGKPLPNGLSDRSIQVGLFNAFHK